MHYICSACSSPNLLAYFSCFSLSLALLSTSDCDLGWSLGSLPLSLSLYRWEETNTNLEATDRTFREAKLSEIIIIVSLRFPSNKQQNLCIISPFHGPHFTNLHVFILQQLLILCSREQWLQTKICSTDQRVFHFSTEMFLEAGVWISFHGGHHPARAGAQGCPSPWSTKRIRRTATVGVDPLLPSIHTPTGRQLGGHTPGRESPLYEQ